MTVGRVDEFMKDSLWEGVGALLRSSSGESEVHTLASRFTFGSQYPRVIDFFSRGGPHRWAC